MRIGTAAALALVLGACAVEPESIPHTRTAVAGPSSLAEIFTRVGADTGIPPEVLAATSYIRTRLAFANVRDAAHAGESIGLFGLREAELVEGAALAGVTDQAARSDAEASLRAAAALLRASAPDAVILPDWLAALGAVGGPGLEREVTMALIRGIAGRDPTGARLVVAAHPELPAPGLGALHRIEPDYHGAVFDPASTSNYASGTRGVGVIDHIVVHDTEGGFNGTLSWFKNPAAGVSAHYVVRSSDGHVVQMVKEQNVAWHDRCFNATTVGIEHEGYAAHPEDWYTEPMYLESAGLAAYLADKYGIAKEKGPIIGHGEAPDCSDHTDPGPGWDWEHYIDLVRTGGAPMFAAADATVEAPMTLVSGETAKVTISLANTGNTTWDLDITRLATTAPQDRESALFVDGDWLSPSRASAVEDVVPPGGTGTFTFTIVAPEVAEPTLFDEAFQPVEEGVVWFGPEIHVMLNVMPADDVGSADLTGGCATAGSSGAPCVILVLGALGLARRRRRPR